MDNKFEKIIYETETFKAIVNNKPHISREDGGHIRIKSKEKNFESRFDLSPKEAKEVMRLTMLVGEAMINGMKKRGINIERINYQDNGNWAYLKGSKPSFHIHLYGRVKNCSRQPFGEALYFPNPKDEYYNNLNPLDDSDIESIRTQIKELENSEKYKLNNW